jgi:cytochrome c-type biogenesis protein CcmF
MDSLRATDDGQKQMITAHVTVFEGTKEIARMSPARWFFRKHEEEPTTEVAIRRAAGEDLYVVLAGYDPANQTATYAVTVNPLVNWIWLGFGVIAIGTGLALLPDTAFAFAASQAPAGAAATTSILLLLMLLPVPLRAQSPENAAVIQRSAVERQLETEILCTCGCRRSLANCGMPNCEGHAAQTAKLRQYLKEGKDHDAVVAAFIAEFGGQDILSAPVDKGFNRLAWLFPYLIGASGAAMVGFAAFKWSRLPHEPAEAAPAAGPADRVLQSRLDDELRDLD